MECNIFDGIRKALSLGYAAYRLDIVSGIDAGIDSVQIAGSCIRRFSSKREKNPFAFDLSNVKFDSKHMRTLDYCKYRESPLHKKWERESRWLNEQIKHQAGLS